MLAGKHAHGKALDSIMRGEEQRVFAWAPALSLVQTIGMVTGRARVHFREAIPERKYCVDNLRVLCPRRCLGSGNKISVISHLYQL